MQDSARLTLDSPDIPLEARRPEAKWPADLARSGAARAGSVGRRRASTA
jgi:hypothetical protein